ncbi:hypothetical protein PILCRDRAFT_817199 [Piloderma croceum F 1598]|uniref:Uncharacterized protein n=1 Tax=Piloderma croceum (strain F 1598) TaxID=765440 RepID=A0A0C3FMA9_PILCF|nr:hypothetical protein PILCRDRAFT_817199 [Piloderma croceum F 1598]
MRDISSVQPFHLDELDNLKDAVEHFTKMISRNGGGSVRLHCSIPTWCPASDIYNDLHDLHDLRTRFLLFIHSLLESLRASGIPASYALAPSSSPLCLVCALHPDLSAFKAKTAAIQVFQGAQNGKRDNVLLGDLEHGPALMIT